MQQRVYGCRALKQKVKKREHFHRVSRARNSGGPVSMGVTLFHDYQTCHNAASNDIEVSPCETPALLLQGPPPHRPPIFPFSLPCSLECPVL